MIEQLMTEVARERAAFLRDAAYIQENVKDSDIKEAVFQYECAESGLFLESEQVTAEMKKNIEEALNKVKVDKDEVDAEIDRIVTSEKDDLSLDDVMGVDSNMTQDAERLLDDVADLAMDNDIDSPVEPYQ